jgi:tetratricopeptide (TPR) repeat protein
VYKAKNDLGNAARTCRQGIELNPYYAATYVCYGDVLLAQGDSAQAADQYKRASELYPAWDEPRNKLQKLSVVKTTIETVHVLPAKSASKTTSLTVHGHSYKLAPDPGLPQFKPSGNHSSNQKHSAN